MPTGVYLRTEEHKARISAAMKGKQNFLGHRHTAEIKASISAKMMGNQNSLGCRRTPEYCAAQSARMKGKQNALGHRCTPEECAARSARMMGNQIAKGKQNFLGHKHSSEAKIKIGIARRGKQTTLGYKHTDEARANMSAAQKARMQTKEGKAILAKATRAACAAKPTKLEKALYRMLDAFGQEYDTEVAFAPYIVDAYIPSLHLALEADGAFHFKGNPFIGTTPEEEAKRTKIRDAYLQEHYSLEVWHFTEEMLKSNDNKNPLVIKGA